MTDGASPRARGPASGHLAGIGKAFFVVAAIAWIVFATIVIVLRYVVLPHVDDYRPQIEGLASRASGETVRIGAITATWSGLRPSLSLRALRIVDAQGSDALLLPAVHATLSWDSVLLLQPRFASIEIDAPELAVRRDAQGQLLVAGIPIRRKASPDNRAAEWLLSQHEIRIRNARVVWRDETTTAAGDAAPEDLVLSDVQFALLRSGRRHRVALRATPPVTLAAPLDVRAVIDHPLFAMRLADPAAWRGELYANVGTGDVVAWRQWIPLPATVDAGRGRARVWMRFAASDAPAGSFARRLAERTGRPVPPALDRIADVTADLALDDVAVRWGAMEYAALASIDGRIVASQTATGQRFAALHMALQPRGGHLVPATDFHVERTIGATLGDEAGKASLGAIDIGVSLGLVPGALVPPPIAEKFAALRPRGILDGMTLSWTGPIAAPRTFQLDARFEQLALAAQAPTAEAIATASREVVAANGLVRKAHAAFGQPGFERIGGTLSATRTGAPGGAALTTVAMTVRGDDVTVTAPGLFDDPVLRLAQLEARVGIKLQGTDLEVRVERAALQNADLAGTVDLTFRHGPNSGGIGDDGGRGWIDLDARLSRAQVERVPRYLPNIIGEKARRYLHKALLGGQVTEAAFRMHGALAQLDLRAMPGALAAPNPVGVADALIAIRDAKAPPHGAVADAKAATTDAPLFRAVIKVKGATFLYGPARDPDAVGATGTAPAALPSIPWPVFEDLDADIVFDQTRMTVFGHSTRVYGYRLVDVRADLPALADPAHVLRVVGHGNGPLQDLVRFINASPVSRWTRGFTATTIGTGDAPFALALDLPLTHPRDAEVAGSLQFVGNDLALNAVIPPLQRLRGRLDFTDRGLFIDGLTGTTLGGPLRVDAATRSDGFIELGAAGTIDIDALKADRGADEVGGVATPVSLAVDRAARWLSGSAPYRIDLRLKSKRMAELANGAPAAAAIAAESAARPDLVVQSDLAGLAIALPAPLAKTADARWPLRIAITRSGDVAAAPDREDIRVSLDTPFGALLDADVSRRRDAQGVMAVARGSYVVGGGKATVDGPSIVDVALPSLDLDAWRDVVRQATARLSNAPVTTPTASSSLDHLLPSHATLKTPLLRVGGRDFTQVAIDAERMPSGWRSDIVADQVAGRLSYTDVSGNAATRGGVAPPSTGRLVARLSHVTIPPAEPGGPRIESALDASRQRDFPAIDVVVDRFELRGRPLGRLEVVAENVGAGDDRAWNLEKLGLTTPEARFAAHGSWGHAASAEHTRLDFDLQSSDVGALMDRFGLTRTIKNGTAQLSGDVSWTGGPSTIDFDTMQGSLRLAADKGQFLKADPGIAKLLNVLSLQGLARRLTFDFNDVFAAGFAFDTVRADAVVDRGIATTDDFAMKGVQATVFMSGNADLAHETTNLHVRVVPDINAGAASLGVAVVNPVLGLGTFVAQYLFKDRISKALTFEYNVVGPWARPEVTKIDRNGKETPVVPRNRAAMRDEAPAKPIE